MESELEIPNKSTILSLEKKEQNLSFLKSPKQAVHETRLSSFAPLQIAFICNEHEVSKFDSWSVLFLFFIFYFLFLFLFLFLFFLWGSGVKLDEEL